MLFRSKLSYGVGVERTFPVHTPVIEKYEVLRRGDVRRAKIYYLRDLRGKASKIKERRGADGEIIIEETFVAETPVASAPVVEAPVVETPVAEAVAEAPVAEAVAEAPVAEAVAEETTPEA